MDTPNQAIKKLSLTEKIIFYSLVFIFVLSGLNLLNQVNNNNLLAEIPTQGGDLIEGVIGTPRFINPVLAISDTDRDLSSLLYSGLMKYEHTGELVLDLAKSYEVSDDGLNYTFRLKDDLHFHDGTPLTTDDIEFTILKTEDPAIKSPKSANWKGVKLKKIDGQTIEFSLSQPYPPFLGNLTLGILPKHLWKDLDSEQFPFTQYNTEPIGSGPFELKTIERKSGIATAYTLQAFDDYTLGRPYLNTLTLRFYNNERDLLTAYKTGLIESLDGLTAAGLNSLTTDKKLTINNLPLSHTFAFFLNQNQNRAFTFKEIRSALNETLDRNLIVTQALLGTGEKLFGPIPPSFFTADFSPTATTSPNYESLIKSLGKSGWLPNPSGNLEKKVKKEITPLAFSIATLNTPELKAIAEIAKSSWEKLGAKVEIKLFDIGELNQNVIRPRKYDILLFGQVIGRDLDFYGYWHSSQRNYPGLNLALYANAKVDKLLEETRKLSDKESKAKNLNAFQSEINNDLPAIFSNTKDHLYLLPTKIKGFVASPVVTPTERFLDIRHWYIETDKVWKIFSH